MLAIDAALEVVAVIFLLAAFVYAMKLLQLTANAEIVALSKPRTVFRLMAFAFASLLLSPILSLWSEFYRTLPLLGEVQNILEILTALFSVMALYTALFFYRTSPSKDSLASSKSEEEQQIAR